MEYALFAALSMFSLFASANDSASTAPAQEAQYDYSHDLDIAKIVRISNANAAGSECGPLKAQLEYVDSKGVRHKLEYTRLGDDCEKG